MVHFSRTWFFRAGSATNLILIVLTCVEQDGGLSCPVCHKMFPNLAELKVHSYLEQHSHTESSKVPKPSILVAADDASVNYLSQLRKRPPMTEVQSVTLLGPFPKRQVPNSGEDVGDVNKLEVAPNDGTKQKVECSASVQQNAAAVSAKSDVCEVGQKNGLQNKLNCDLCGTVQSSPESLQKVGSLQYLIHHVPLICRP